jgi:hypothetical protein
LLEHAAELFGDRHSHAQDAEQRVRELHAKIGELTVALGAATIRTATSETCWSGLPTQPASRIEELLPHRWVSTETPR